MIVNFKLTRSVIEGQYYRHGVEWWCGQVNKPLFPLVRNFTLIAKYCLVPGTDLRVFL